MSKVMLTEAGSLTLDESARRHLGASPGDALDVEEKPDGSLVVRRAGHDISRVFGMLHRPGQRAVSVEEMSEAIARDRAEAFLRETSRPDEP